MANTSEMDELYEMSLRHEIRYAEIVEEYMHRYVDCKSEYEAMQKMREIYGDMRVCQ